MGNEFSAHVHSDTDILGGDDAQELTAEEIATITAQGSIFNCFYRHPTVENYQAIRSQDALYQKALGSKYKVFLWAVRDKFDDLGDPLEEDDSLDYQLEVDRLLDLRNRVSASDLDVLWMLYYATGDMQFPWRIKLVIGNELQHEVVRGAAKWSYDSHIRQGMLEDSEWEMMI